MLLRRFVGVRLADEFAEDDAVALRIHQKTAMKEGKSEAHRQGLNMRESLRTGEQGLARKSNMTYLDAVRVEDSIATDAAKRERKTPSQTFGISETCRPRQHASSAEEGDDGPEFMP